MSLFGSRSGWVQVIIPVWGLDWSELSLLAWEITDRLWSETGAPMYFARYSEPGGFCRIEIKVKLDWSAQRFQGYMQDVGREEIDMPGLRVKDIDGSPAHAQAYLLSRLLRGKGEALTKDVLHWTLNMTGYSYAQEIRIMGEQVAHMADNLEKST